jgi:hypothetical protein
VHTRIQVHAWTKNISECQAIDELNSDKSLFRQFETDAWNGKLTAECSAGKATVRSSGPDGKRGNADDVVFPASPDAEQYRD